MRRFAVSALATLLVAGYAVDGARGANEILGTPEADSIRGTQQDDLIDTLGGDDNARGAGGNDTLIGRRGLDKLQGDGGNDLLKGNGGKDVLLGGTGNDTIHGHGGNDVLRGGGGRDNIKGGVGRDTIRGNGGGDTLDGGPGPDRLAGGGGPDVFLYRTRKGGSDQILDFNPGQKDSIELTGSLRGGALRFDVRGRDTNVSVNTRKTGEFAPLTVLRNTSVPIDVWFGDQQEFGSPGEAQRWVNILGRVAMKDITSLTYSLNGGPPQPLRPGPDGVRLERRGDFNVEIAYGQLDPSAVDDIVQIEATYLGGRRFVRNVTIAYEAGQSWPQAYEIDWSEVTDLQDVIQVVDGNWTFDAQGVRPAEVGYDRLLVIGDADWDSYTVRTSFIVHSWDSPIEGRALWFGSQWGGHTEDPIPESMPSAGFIPLTTFMIQDTGVVLRPSEFFDDRIPANEMVGASINIAEGRRYNVLIRNQRVATDVDLTDGLDRTYSIKIWPANSLEPNGFLVSKTMVDQEPFGAFAIFPHYVSATIGDVTVTPLAKPGVPLSAVAE